MKRRDFVKNVAVVGLTAAVPRTASAFLSAQATPNLVERYQSKVHTLELEWTSRATWRPSGTPEALLDGPNTMWWRPGAYRYDYVRAGLEYTELCVGRRFKKTVTFGSETKTEVDGILPPSRHPFELLLRFLPVPDQKALVRASNPLSDGVLVERGPFRWHLSSDELVTLFEVAPRGGRDGRLIRYSGYEYFSGIPLATRVEEYGPSRDSQQLVIAYDVLRAAVNEPLSVQLKDWR